MSQSKKEMMNRALSAMTMNIGKAGVNDNVIEEIKRQLKANEIVKLKFAKNIAKNKDDYIADIVQKTRSKLIDVITLTKGFSIIFVASSLPPRPTSKITISQLLS